jgi:hypothetical protein
MAKNSHKKEFNVENKGNKGALNTQDKTYRGKYIEVGSTKGMHGKAKGGHPTKRAEEMC